MTLVALLKARGNHIDEHYQAVDAINNAVETVLELPTISMMPHLVIDAVVDALMNIEQIILEGEPPTTPSRYPKSHLAALYKKENPFYQASVEAGLGYPHEVRLPASLEGYGSGTGIFSYKSDFGTSVPGLSERLPRVMGFALYILTRLISHAASFGRPLFDVQEQILAYLAQHLLTTYRPLLKREIMAFCSALHTIITPEERFFALFEDESDRNLLSYCVKSEKFGADAVYI